MENPYHKFSNRAYRRNIFDPGEHKKFADVRNRQVQGETIEAEFPVPNFGALQAENGRDD